MDLFDLNSALDDLNSVILEPGQSFDGGGVDDDIEKELFSLQKEVTRRDTIKQKQLEDRWNAIGAKQEEERRRREEEANRRRELEEQENQKRIEELARQFVEAERQKQSQLEQQQQEFKKQEEQRWMMEEQRQKREEEARRRKQEEEERQRREEEARRRKQEEAKKTQSTSSPASKKKGLDEDLTLEDFLGASFLKRREDVKPTQKSTEVQSKEDREREKEELKQQRKSFLRARSSLELKGSEQAELQQVIKEELDRKKKLENEEEPFDDEPQSPISRKPTSSITPTIQIASPPPSSMPKKSNTPKPKRTVSWNNDAQTISENGLKGKAPVVDRITKYLNPNPRFLAQGPLLKLGQVRKSWKKRWWRLEPDGFYYWASIADRKKQPLGFIPIENVQKIEAMSTQEIDRLKYFKAVKGARNSSEVFAFKINVPEREYHCIAANVEMRDEWVAQGNAALSARKK